MCLRFLWRKYGKDNYDQCEDCMETVLRVIHFMEIL